MRDDYHGVAKENIAAPNINLILIMAAAIVGKYSAADWETSIVAFKSMLNDTLIVA